MPFHQNVRRNTGPISFALFINILNDVLVASEVEEFVDRTNAQDGVDESFLTIRIEQQSLDGVGPSSRLQRLFVMHF